MSVRYRPMEPRDAQACAAVIARHPIVGPRYGEAIRDLCPAWLKLLGSDGLVAAVFEQEGATPKVLGAGVTVFVTDEFIHELKCSPSFWMGPELALRVVRSRSPVLANRQIRDANTSGGLNVAVWQRGVSPEDKVGSEVNHAIMAAFVEMHRGFLVKEIVVQAETAEHAGSIRAVGAFLWNAEKHEYVEFPDVSQEELAQRPHIMGLTRELAFSQNPSWGASTFLYSPPRFGFIRSEQRLLSSGLAGGTDQELAYELGISLVAVRKRWRAIYERVELVAPDLVPDLASGDGTSSERGKAKKQRLLAYVREHPEELRPISRRLMRKTR